MAFLLPVGYYIGAALLGGAVIGGGAIAISKNITVEEARKREEKLRQEL